MFFQLFAVAVVMTAAAVMVTVVLATHEVRNRKAQRNGPFVVTPARSLMDDDDVRGAGQNAELLHAVSRL